MYVSCVYLAWFLVAVLYQLQPLFGLDHSNMLTTSNPSATTVCLWQEGVELSEGSVPVPEVSGAEVAAWCEATLTGNFCFSLELCICTVDVLLQRSRFWREVSTVELFWKLLDLRCRRIVWQAGSEFTVTSTFLSITPFCAKAQSLGLVVQEQNSKSSGVLGTINLLPTAGMSVEAADPPHTAVYRILVCHGDGQLPELVLVYFSPPQWWVSLG